MEKVELEAAVAEGLSISELASRFGFASGGPVRYWLKKYDLQTARAVDPRRGWQFSEEQLAEAVAVSTSVSGVLRHLRVRQQGGSHTHLSRRLRDLGLDMSHFTRSNAGMRMPSRKKPEEILVRLPPGSRRTTRPLLHRALQDEGVEYKCEGCGNTGEWLGSPLLLDIDHRDGDWLNNLIENLRYLCPNCHAQTPTFRNRKRHASVD